MSLIRGGDQQAFATLLSRHVDALYTYAFRLTGSAPNAEDLVQETWLAAWQHARGFNPRKAKVTTWLHRILRNKYIDAARKNRLQLDETAVATLVDDFNAERTAVQHQQTGLLDELIQELPERQRSALVLSYAQGFANRDVAKILGIGLRAAESLLARTRRSLQDSFNIRTIDRTVNGTVNGEASSTINQTVDGTASPSIAPNIRAKTDYE